ncbi:MAG TPA: hypothetical protein VFU71_05270 [Burkholderiaceae bacterium]|nr:hypothetical protein [Burkholderiaceae bacterium]
MHTLSMRSVRGAVCVAIALSAWAGVQVKNPVKPVVVPVHHLQPVATKAPSTPRTQPMAAAARNGDAMRERNEPVDSDGSRFVYDSCGCSNER